MTVEYRAARAKLHLQARWLGERGGPARSKATWAANNLVVTTTTGAGEEKRTFSMEGGNLVVETSAPARAGGAPTITKVTYQRYERGLGG